MGLGLPLGLPWVTLPGALLSSGGGLLPLLLPPPLLPLLA